VSRFAQATLRHRTRFEHRIDVASNSLRFDRALVRTPFDSIEPWFDRALVRTQDRTNVESWLRARSPTWSDPARPGPAPQPTSVLGAPLLGPLPHLPRHSLFSILPRRRRSSSSLYKAPFWRPPSFLPSRESIIRSSLALRLPPSNQPLRPAPLCLSNLPSTNNLAALSRSTFDPRGILCTSSRLGY
jgi:hypothetical protein